MAEIKRFLATLRHIVPSDLEYYLEEEHNSGHILKPLGQEGLFFLKFTEEKPEKCAYMVDISALPRTIYMKTMIEKGWDYMGQTMNCHVWRQYYKKGKRPENLSDRLCLKKHCIRIGLIMAVAALLFLGLFVAYFYFLWAERQRGIQDHFWQYLFLGLIQIPFFAYSAWASRKLFREAESLQKRLENGKIFSRKSVDETVDESTDETDDESSEKKVDESADETADEE